MSRGSEPTLHIEWSPGCVEAVDIATGQSRTGPSLAALGPVLAGHKTALVGVSRSLVFLRTMRLPKAPAEDLRRILQVQIGQIFPLPAEQLAFDTIQTADRTAEGCLTVVAAVRTEDLRRLRSELKQAGIQPARVMPVAFGAPAVTATAGVDDAVLISDTPGGLALDIVQGGFLRLSRIVPPESDAVLEARRTLAASRLEGLPIVASSGTSVAGALAGDGTPLTRLNHAPPLRFELAEERAREARQQVATRNRMATLFLAAALLLVAYLWTERSDAAATVQKGEASWSRQLTKLRKTRDREVARAERASAIAQELKTAFHPAQPLSDVLALVGDNLPASVWMTGVNLERGKPAEIRGTAKSPDDVAQFGSVLGATPRMRDVRLVYANGSKIENTRVVQFDLSAFAVGNLPMPEPPKTRGRSRAAATTGGAELTQ